MSARRSPVEGTATEWLTRARSALTLARQRATGILLEDLCYQAHQAAEKALKGVCVDEGVNFPFTHDVRYLLRLLAEEGIEAPESLREAAILTDYAVATRYPSAAEPVSEGDYEEALRLAEAVVDWAEMKSGVEGSREPPDREIEPNTSR